MPDLSVCGAFQDTVCLPQTAARLKSPGSWTVAGSTTPETDHLSRNFVLTSVPYTIKCHDPACGLDIDIYIFSFYLRTCAADFHVKTQRDTWQEYARVMNVKQLSIGTLHAHDSCYVLFKTGLCTFLPVHTSCVFCLKVCIIHLEEDLLKSPLHIEAALHDASWELNVLLLSFGLGTISEMESHPAAHFPSSYTLSPTHLPRCRQQKL